MIKCYKCDIFSHFRIPVSSETSSRSVRWILQTPPHSASECYTALTPALLYTRWAHRYKQLLHSLSASACVIQAAVGKHAVKDVYLSANTKKLMVRLADSCDRLHSDTNPSWNTGHTFTCPEPTRHWATDLSHICLSVWRLSFLSEYTLHCVLPPGQCSPVWKWTLSLFRAVRGVEESKDWFSPWKVSKIK